MLQLIALMNSVDLSTKIFKTVAEYTQGFFSRIKCEKLAESIQYSLLDYDEQRMVNDIIDKNII